MNRLPFWSSVACTGLLVFAAPVALAGNNNNNKPAPSRPAAAPARPAVQAPHPGGGAPNMAGRGGNPMMGAGARPGPGGMAGGQHPFGAPGGNGMAGGQHPFGAPGGNGMAGNRPGPGGMAAGQHPFGGPGGPGGNGMAAGQHPYAAPGGNGMAGGQHPFGGPGGNGMAGGPHGGPGMAGPAGGPHGDFHNAGGPGPMPHGGPMPGAGRPPGGGPGFGNAAAHNFGGPGGRPGGFAGHQNFAPAAHVTGVATAHTMSRHDFVEHRTEVARNFGPGHNVAHDREFVHAHEHDFHSRDVREFTDVERARWDGGSWHQDWHYGRWGWWYQVDDVWYPYATPVYPYPQTVAEIVVPETVVVDTRPGLVAEYGGDQLAVAAPLAVATTAPTGEEMVVRPLPIAPTVTYNCTTYSNVYPAVRLCPVTWAVVAQ